MALSYVLNQYKELDYVSVHNLDWTLGSRLMEVSPEYTFLYVEDIQQIYDNKIKWDSFHETYIEYFLDNVPEHRKANVRINAETRAIKELFLIAVCADRVEHFLNFFKGIITPANRYSLMLSLWNFLASEYRYFSTFVTRFKFNFIEFQIDMFKDILTDSSGIGEDIRLSNIFYCNSDIKGISDFYSLYNNNSFLKEYSPNFKFFIGAIAYGRINIFRNLPLTIKETEFINSLVGTEDEINFEILNKIPIEDIEALLSLNINYSIRQFYLTEPTYRKFTSTDIDKYLERYSQTQSNIEIMYPKTNTLDRLLQYVDLDLLSDDLIKKYFKIFIEGTGQYFVCEVLDKRFDLKTMLNLLEECA